MKNSTLILKFVLCILTGGIYALYWMCALDKEIKSCFGQTVRLSQFTLVLLTLLTGGRFAAYWYYKAYMAVTGSTCSAVNNECFLFVVLALVGGWMIPLPLFQYNLDRTPSLTF